MIKYFGGVETRGYGHRNRNHHLDHENPLGPYQFPDLLWHPDYQSHHLLGYRININVLGTQKPCSHRRNL